MKKAVIIFILIAFVPAFLYADMRPMETIKIPIDEGMKILTDPKYKDPSLKKVQREKIWDVVRKVFDFTELGGRTLATNWKNFSPDQRKEFTEVFSEILGNAYLDKIQGAYKDEKVEYVGKEMITDSKAIVKTKIVRKKGEILVDYSMKLKDNSWKVYDVQAEGISLVQNYRSQFNEILVKESPDDLIKRLHKKLEEQQKTDKK
ncbi:MAG: ABC transporter substrate-binding protein [Proteobacteria bacterium]|nr:ABC transporter substrate-binding protein [Pseudomonadota bacterium]